MRAIWVCTLVTLVLGAPAASAAPILINPDFETGDLTGWTTFTTPPTGVANPSVSSFDVDGDSSSSLAATFRVGDTSAVPANRGGGIFQNFVTSANGQFLVSADVARSNRGTSGNSEGGAFSVIVDGVTLDTFPNATIPSGATQRDILTASVFLTAGTHELRFLMTRSADAPLDLFQYIDDVSVTEVTAVPEPGSLLLLGTSVAGLLARARSRQRAAR